MGTLVIKNVPQALHVRLKEQARRHHRSLTKEVISLVEAGLDNPSTAAIDLPPPIEARGDPLTIADIESAIELGRQ